MSKSAQNKTAPMWQRVFIGILAVIGFLSVLSQVIADPGLVELSILEWIRLVVTAIALFCFVYIALKGHLPGWLLQQEKTPDQ